MVHQLPDCLPPPGRHPGSVVIAQIWYVAFFIAGVIGANLLFRQI
jgi:hypothetical protein